MNTFVHICKLSLGHSLFIFAKGFPSQYRFRLLSQKDTSVLLLQSRTNGIQCYSCSPLFHRLRESITIQKKNLFFQNMPDKCRFSLLSKTLLFFLVLVLDKKRDLSMSFAKLSIHIFKPNFPIFRTHFLLVPLIYPHLLSFS